VAHLGNITDSVNKNQGSKQTVTL